MLTKDELKEKITNLVNKFSESGVDWVFQLNKIMKFVATNSYKLDLLLLNCVALTSILKELEHLESENYLLFYELLLEDSSFKATNTINNIEWQGSIIKLMAVWNKVRLLTKNVDEDKNKRIVVKSSSSFSANISVKEKAWIGSIEPTLNNWSEKRDGTQFMGYHDIDLRDKKRCLHYETIADAMQKSDKDCSAVFMIYNGTYTEPVLFIKNALGGFNILVSTSGFVHNNTNYLAGLLNAEIIQHNGMKVVHNGDCTVYSEIVTCAVKTNAMSCGSVYEVISALLKNKNLSLSDQMLTSDSLGLNKIPVLDPFILRRFLGLASSTLFFGLKGWSDFLQNKKIDPETMLAENGTMMNYIQTNKIEYTDNKHASQIEQHSMIPQEWSKTSIKQQDTEQKMTAISLAFQRNQEAETAAMNQAEQAINSIKVVFDLSSNIEAQKNLLITRVNKIQDDLNTQLNTIGKKMPITTDGVRQKILMIEQQAKQQHAQIQQQAKETAAMKTNQAENNINIIKVPEMIATEQQRAELVQRVEAISEQLRTELTQLGQQLIGNQPPYFIAQKKITAINLAFQSNQKAEAAARAQEDFTRLIEQFSLIKTGLETKNASNPKYVSAVRHADDLIHNLTTHSDIFFENPSQETFVQFKTACTQDIELASDEFKKHRGFHTLNPILRGILGIIAALAIIPALASTRTDCGYVGMFFSTPETNSIKKLKEQEKNTLQLLDSIESSGFVS